MFDCDNIDNLELDGVDDVLIKTLCRNRERIEKVMIDCSIEILPILYREWYKNEKRLQKLCKNCSDNKYIKFWTVPRCTCLSLDNERMYPNGGYYVSCSCIVHSNGVYFDEDL